jgi:hypothetical protein
MKHPVTGKWILMGNWQYIISDNPVNYMDSEVHYYNNELNGKAVDMGFACEIVNYNGNWYRSGVFGEIDHWKLGFSQIAWDENGAFNIVKPSIINLNTEK